MCVGVPSLSPAPCTTSYLSVALHSSLPAPASLRFPHPPCQPHLLLPIAVALSFTIRNSPRDVDQNPTIHTSETRNSPSRPSGR
jgi:hypothetical protein